MKYITTEQSQALTLFDLLEIIHTQRAAAGSPPDAAHRFRVEAPCGCITTYILQVGAGNSDGCTNRELTPSEVN